MTTLGRREFLAGAGAVAIAGVSHANAAGAALRLSVGASVPAMAGIFPASVRADFPSVARETYLNSAAMHPIGTFAAQGVMARKVGCKVALTFAEARGVHKEDSGRQIAQILDLEVKTFDRLGYRAKPGFPESECWRGPSEFSSLDDDLAGTVLFVGFHGDKVNHPLEIIFLAERKLNR